MVQNLDKMKRNARRKRAWPRRSKSVEMAEQMAAKLPQMLNAALDAYERITAAPLAEDPKAQSAQQAAAKAALSHVETLMKMLQGAVDCAAMEASEEEGEDVTALIATARSAIDGMQ